MASVDGVCTICNCQFQDADRTTEVGARGLETLIRASQERGDGKHVAWRDVEKLTLHIECRASYIVKGSISAAKRRRVSSEERQTEGFETFNYKKLCIFCGQPCSEQLELKKPKHRRRKIHRVLPSSTLKSRVLEACSSAIDGSNTDILSRFTEVDNLSTVDAKYHHGCDSDVITKLVPKENVAHLGHTKYQQQFEKLFEFLENCEDSQWTLDEIIEIMGEPSPGRKYIKEVLIKRYENNIIFSSRGSSRTVVTLKGFGKDILLDYFKNSIQVENDDEKKSKILKLAAKYIREDIRATDVENEYYPPANAFFTDENINEVIPTSLRSFLSDIILPQKKNIENYKRKIDAISHAIMSATRPQSFISSLQLGVAIYIHSKYQSKLLINILHRMGMCVSYDETLLYEGSAVMSPHSTIEPTCNSFVQYIWDNADYDVHTIDGKNSFHYTAGIQTITPHDSTHISLSILRLKRPPSASAIAHKFKMKIYDYTIPEIRGLQQIKIKDIRALRTLSAEKTHFRPGEMLWTVGHSLKIPEHPGWSGFMELRTNSAIFDVSKVKYLPFIYLKATDESSIFSAMMFGIKEARRTDQRNVFFTFDQQLYIKAREILADVQHKLVPCDEKMDNVFIRLGGFHLIMSFLSCIGKIMDGSGLKEAWSTVYAEKSIEKMLTNYYTQAALLLLIIEECNLSVSEREQLEEILDLKAEDQELITRTDQLTALEKLERNVQVIELLEEIKIKMNNIAERSKTASLWTQYIKMVSLFRSLIEAERTGNFELDLSTIIDMIPFFHACSHFNYAKSAHLYVQDNLELKERMNSPEEYEAYVERGYFSIRRTHKFFSGVSPDMVIEQTMMRSIHGMGGLVHGRGITESVAASWLNTLNCSTYINDDLENYCQFESTFSEQHKDLRDKTVSRDLRDLQTLKKWFDEHPPFPNADDIISLSTGVSGNLDVNCYQAEYIGLQSYRNIIPKSIVEHDGSMTIEEKNFGTLKFNRDFQVIPLSVSNGEIKIGLNKFPIDEKILFQRFQKSEPDPRNLPEYLQYELCPFPVSIFDSPLTMRTVKDDFFTFFTQTMKPNDIHFFVIDGETLLSQISWSINRTYQSIYEQYVHFVIKNYGRQCTVIFDSMTNEITAIKESQKLLTLSTKSVATEIFFDATKYTTKKRDALFQNQKNKLRFIQQLINTLTSQGITVKLMDKDDMNNKIVYEAIEKSQNDWVTAVVSNNVDILCLLAAYASTKQNIHFYAPNKAWYSTLCVQQQYQKLFPYLHVLRAFLGCDVTSSFFNISRKTCIKKILKHQDEVAELLKIFTLESSVNNVCDLILAGEKIIVFLYNGKAKDLNDLRYQKYMTSLKSSRKTNFNVATLPPTSAAAQYHSYRVYWQVQRWQNNILPSLFWGWQVAHGTLIVPTTTTSPPVPEDLLNLIVCSCKKGCRSRTCSCIKSGLTCSHLCKECTDTCVNKATEIYELDEILEDQNDPDADFFTEFPIMAEERYAEQAQDSGENMPGPSSL